MYTPCAPCNHCVPIIAGALAGQGVPRFNEKNTFQPLRSLFAWLHSRI